MVVSKVFEFLWINILASVLLLSSLMGKNESKWGFTHAVTYETSVLGKSLTQPVAQQRKWFIG